MLVKSELFMHGTHHPPGSIQSGHGPMLHHHHHSHTRTHTFTLTLTHSLSCMHGHTHTRGHRVKATQEEDATA